MEEKKNPVTEHGLLLEIPEEFANRKNDNGEILLSDEESYNIVVDYLERVAKALISLSALLEASSGQKPTPEELLEKLNIDPIKQADTYWLLEAMLFNKDTQLLTEFISLFNSFSEKKIGTAEFISTSSGLVYRTFNKALYSGKFAQHENDYPDKEILNNDWLGFAIMRPSKQGYITEEEKEAYRVQMWSKVLELYRMGDLAADVFDIVIHKWIQKARYPDEMIYISADEILQSRGIKDMHGKTDGFSYREDQRQEVRKFIDVLSHYWITIKEVKKPHIKNIRGIEAPALVVTAAAGQVTINETIEADAWRIRPGDFFAKELLTNGPRQTLLLSQKALNYDPDKYQQEKRLARYFAGIWRIDEETTRKGIRIELLLSEIDESMNMKRPGRTKDRIEKALDRLEKDGIIRSWDYKIPKGYEITDGERGWARKWLEWKIIVNEPEAITEHYKQLREIKKTVQKKLKKPAGKGKK